MLKIKSKSLRGLREDARPTGPRLWLRLWFAYAIVSFIGVNALFVVVGSFFEYRAYSAAYTEQNLKAYLESEAAGISRIDDATFQEALNGGGYEVFLDRLLRFRSSDPEIDQYTLERVSNPWARITLSDESGNEIGKIETEIGLDQVDASKALRASTTILRGGKTYIAKVGLYAPFSAPRLVERYLSEIVENSGFTLFISAFMGLLCGLISARYITRRLALMNDTTARWRLGQFDQMIEIGSGDELGMHAQRLNAMASELETHLNLKQALAVSDERTRIARDLHDTVKQNLFALGLQLAAIRGKLGTVEHLPADFEENLSEAEGIAREAQHDLVEIIDQLRPSEDSPKTLGSMLQAVAESLEKRLSTKINVSIKNDLTVSPLMEVDLLRVVRELATNAVRHGDADLVDIILSSKGDTVDLVIADDGQGFDSEAPRHGLGLRSVEHRVSTFPDGVFQIDAEPNAGTQILVSWKHDDDPR